MQIVNSIMVGWKKTLIEPEKIDIGQNTQVRERKKKKNPTESRKSKHYLDIGQNTQVREREKKPTESRKSKHYLD